MPAVVLVDLVVLILRDDPYGMIKCGWLASIRGIDVGLGGVAAAQQGGDLVGVDTDRCCFV